MADRANLRILLVDDDPAMVRQLGVLLETLGFSRWRAVERVADVMAAAADADILLLDQQLPDGTGLDVLAGLRRTVSPPSVIMITGHGSESIAAAALRLGADDYLIKDENLPVLLPQVIERVRRYRAIRDALGAAERDLVRAERLAAVGEVTVTLRHEINNPLMVAMAELELLLLDAGLSDDARAAAQRALEATERIRNTLRQVAELQQAESGDYAGGLQMIRLEDQGPDATRPGLAMICVDDDGLARLASRLLHHAGFGAERVRSRDVLVERMGSVPPGLVLVGGEFAERSDDPVARRRKGSDPWHFVALLPEGAIGEPAWADDVVHVPFDPGTFAHDIIASMARRAYAPSSIVHGSRA